MLEEVHPSVVDDLGVLLGNGHHVVLVHGGGDYVTQVAEKLGKKQVFVTSPEGIRSRYTDYDTVEIYTMVMCGLLAKKIVRLLESRGLRAVSISGVDDGLLRAERKKKLLIVDDRGRKVAVEGGYTGKIVGVNTPTIQILLEHGVIPVVSPVALGQEHEFLNVDGDRACASLAGSLAAECAVFLTDTDGVYLDGQLVTSLSPTEARALLPRIGRGMDVKLLAAVEAVEKGAKKAVIAPGSKENPLLNAISGHGTTITSAPQ